MTNWKVLAAALDPPVGEEDLKRIFPALEKMEAVFRVHQAAILVDGLMWAGPEDAE